MNSEENQNFPQIYENLLLRGIYSGSLAEISLIFCPKKKVKHWSVQSTLEKVLRSH